MALRLPFRRLFRGRRAGRGPGPGRRGILRRLFRLLFRAVAAVLLLSVLWVGLYRVVPPPVTPYMVSEWIRLGELRYEWRGLDDMSRWVPLSAAAAEDARFCDHSGFDFEAIRDALSDTSRLRGASTISQQVAKNAFLWQGRSWLRKGLEAGFTVLVELLWSKERIIEVYVNIAEMDTGTFGAAAAARVYFDRDVSELSVMQAARIAAVLPNPKERSAAAPTAFVSQRANAIARGAETLLASGRAACFGITR